MSLRNEIYSRTMPLKAGAEVNALSFESKIKCFTKISHEYIEGRLINSNREILNETER